MDSKLLSRRDLDFLLYEWLDVEKLTARPRYAAHSRETFDAFIDLSSQLAARHFAPHNRKSDANEPTFDGERIHMIPEVGQALEAFAQAGFFGRALGEDDGGVALPAAVAGACSAWFTAANTGTSTYAFLTIANAHLLNEHGTREQIDTYVRPMSEGRFFGTMCLSEPQAGSSLSDVTTKAIEQPDGTYRIFGNKMWISGGDHELAENIVHLVLARTPDASPGVKGLSLFIVPKFLVSQTGVVGERNDVVLAGLNHKMGYRGTTNCLLNFGEGKFEPGGQSGAVGYLVGERDRGLAYMFHMMNAARVGVGMGATVLGYTGYLHALDYARTRLQGRPLMDRDATSPQVPIIEHTDVRRMLLAQKSYVEGGLALNMYCRMLIDEQDTGETDVAREEAKHLLDVLTPIAKAWPSQWCLEANSLAIQVHGGYGYTREYDVEQFYRDNRLNAIHEGTNGIQALDLLGRKVIMGNGVALIALVNAMDETIAASRARPELVECADALEAAVARVGATTMTIWGPRDPDLGLANASIYLEAVGHVVVAWCWLQLMVAAAGKDGDFYEGKRRAGAYFFRYELPKTGPQFDLLDSLDRTTLDMASAWF